jgi:hypothetical protein
MIRIAASSVAFSVAASVLVACGEPGDASGETDASPPAVEARWAAMEIPASPPLAAVWVASPRLAFAVGQGGVILEFDGAAWSRVESPTGRDLVGLWGSGVQRTWAITVDGAVLARDAGVWRIARPGDGQPLRAICGRDASDVWALGDAGHALRTVGEGFMPVEVVLPDRLDGLFIDALGRGALLGRDAGGALVGAAYDAAVGWGPPAPVSGGSGLVATDLWGNESGALFATALTGDGRGALLALNAGALVPLVGDLEAPAAVFPLADTVLVGDGERIVAVEFGAGAGTEARTSIVEAEALGAPVADIQGAAGLVLAVGGALEGRIWRRAAP